MKKSPGYPIYIYLSKVVSDNETKATDYPHFFRHANRAANDQQLAGKNAVDNGLSAWISLPSATVPNHDVLATIDNQQSIILQSCRLL